jgi:hypothetical protein
MRFFRNSTLKYPSDYIHAWRLNENGNVEFRDCYEDDWYDAMVLTNFNEIEDAIMRGSIEECDNPFKEYDCLNDN